MSHYSVAYSIDDVISQYRTRLNDLQTQLSVTLASKARYRVITLIILFGALCTPVLALVENRPIWPVFIALLFACAVCFRSFARIRKAAYRLIQLTSLHTRAIDRTSGDEPFSGNTGAEFTRTAHLYETDLSILGEASLFDLLCTTRSHAGAERLAALLLDSSSFKEAELRQEAIRELRFDLGLRERIATLGKYQFQDCNAEQIRNWASDPILRIPRQAPILMFSASLLCAVLGLCGFAGIFAWSRLFVFLAPCLAVQAFFTLKLAGQVRPKIAALISLSGIFTVLREGLALMEEQSFASEHLRKLVQRVRNDRAADHLGSLERLLKWVAFSRDPVIYGFALWLGAGTQIVLGAERWRSAHRDGLLVWLSAWAEFDVLNAIANYAYEHPQDCFPELVDGDSCFEAKDLGHPLLADGSCVRNDVSLNRSTPFYIVSGSNMSGKSTLLKAIGTNAVLAGIGAPVRASKARISVFALCASIGLTDSLAEGRSKFLAELERLRDAVKLTCGYQPVLFLIDEMLSGTNSHERCIIACEVISALLRGKAVGAISTHDLSLTEMTDRSEISGINLHMQSENLDDPLDFDYRLKPGKLRQTNAVAILRLIGI
ncbi:MAG TPA: hypothetical protein VGS10_01420 [Terracidiphilus sp.]|nr:hypothetical protein [Terracidiphilus sp.]